MIPPLLFPNGASYQRASFGSRWSVHQLKHLLPQELEAVFSSSTIDRCNKVIMDVLTNIFVITDCLIVSN